MNVVIYFVFPFQWFSRTYILIVISTVQSVFMHQAAWPGGLESIFRSSSQTATCPLSTTQSGGLTIFRFIADRPQ